MGLGSSLLTEPTLLRGTGCSLETGFGGLVKIFSFISRGSRKLKFRSAGDKHVEPSSCRFLLDKREEKGIRGIIIKGALKWEERCCHIPFTVTCLLLLIVLLPSEIKVTLTGAGADKPSARPHLYGAVTDRLVWQSHVYTKGPCISAFLGKSSYLSHIASARRKTECIQRRSKWSSNIPGSLQWSPRQLCGSVLGYSRILKVKNPSQPYHISVTPARLQTSLFQPPGVILFYSDPLYHVLHELKLQILANKMLSLLSVDMNICQ